MSNGYSPKQLLAVPVTLGASVSAQQVGDEYGVSAGGALNIRVDILVSGVTAGSGISAKLQQRTFSTWTDISSANGTVAITANGQVSIRLMVARTADQADMPLQKQVRVVLTTGTGSAVTVDKICILQPL